MLRHAVFTVSWLCATGVAQVLNRLDGKPFDDADQRLFEVLYHFLGVGEAAGE